MWKRNEGIRLTENILGDIFVPYCTFQHSRKLTFAFVYQQ